MNKAQLVSAIANSVDLSQAQAEKVVDATLEGILETLINGDHVSLVGFGNFGTKKRAARKVKNPQTGAQMQIAATIVPFFKAGKNLKEAVDTLKETKEAVD